MRVLLGGEKVNRLHIASDMFLTNTQNIYKARCCEVMACDCTVLPTSGCIMKTFNRPGNAVNTRVDQPAFNPFIFPSFFLSCCCLFSISPPLLIISCSFFLSPCSLPSRLHFKGSVPPVSMETAADCHRWTPPQSKKKIKSDIRLKRHKCC